MINMSRSKKWLWLLLAGLVILAAGLTFFSPNNQDRVDLFTTRIRGFLNPVGQMPTPDSVGVGLFMVEIPVSSESFTVQYSNGSEPNLVPQTPSQVQLQAPSFNPHQDYQDWNNCGPATLALALRMWQWQGDQFDISAVIRPNRQDKNVKIEEMAAYVNQNTERLRAEVRVGGDLWLLKRFIMAGYAVVIEEGFQTEKSAWPGDDLWAGHYLLLTGYDDSAGEFTVQDSYHGPNQRLDYENLLTNWQAFNHTYMIVYSADRQLEVQTLLGAEWLLEENINHAIDLIGQRIQSNKANTFDWFNLSSNYVALNDHPAGWTTFQNARRMGFPQRMLRYQFGPFEAAFETGNKDELEILIEYALKITPDSEEALYWKGKSLLQTGDTQAAATFFQKALEINPNNLEAKIAFEELHR